LSAQTEDEVYIGKGKTFGNYKSGNIRPVNGQINPVSGLKTMTGTIVSGCKRDCCNRKSTFCFIDIQTADSLVRIGTRDNGFSVPKDMVGQKIVVEGTETTKLGRERRPRKDVQNDVQFTATGVKVLNRSTTLQ
jgi:hypothetical protein